MMENCVRLRVFVRARYRRKDHGEADASVAFYFFSCHMERPFSPHRKNLSDALLILLS